MRNRLLCYTLIIMMLAIAPGCGSSKEMSKSRAEAVPVKVKRVTSDDMNRVLEYVGNIKGQDEALVYPKVSGKIIEKVKEEGEFVAKCDIIAYIDRDEVGLKFEKAPVESPLTGTVGRIYVDIGSSVNTQTPVALISNIDKAEILLDIPEKYLPKISIGEEALVMVDAYPGEKFTGHVDMISPIVDLQTRAAPIEIVIENKDHRLQSGMFARISLVIERYKAVPVVMKESVMGRPPHSYVYVVEGDKAVMKKVVLGVRQGPYYQVIDGLEKDDMVVVMGQQRLKDGSRVTVEE